MSLFGSIFKGAGKIGSQVGSFFGGGDSKYKSENDLPWFERSLLKAGAGLEGIDKKKNYGDCGIRRLCSFFLHRYSR